MSNRVTDDVKKKLEPVVPRLSHRARTARAATPRLADYVRNVLRSAPRSRLKGQLMRRLNSGDLFEGLFPELQDERDHKRIEAFLATWRRSTPPSSAPRVPNDGVAQNVRRLQEILSLSEADGRLIHLYLDVRRYPELGEFLAAFPVITESGVAEMVAAATLLDKASVAHALHDSGPLLSSGVLVRQSHNDFPNTLQIPDPMMDALAGPPLDVASLSRRLFQVDPGPTLGLENFTHLPGCQLAVDLMAAALKAKRAGVNVLLHGPPGTGKTAFASALAASVGARLLHVGGSDSDGDSASPHERLSMLRAGLRIALPSTMLLFDEFEDVFVERLRRLGMESRVSKLHLNRLLEQTSVPVIWTTNSTEGIDRAFLRRFALAIEFRPATAGQRAGLLRKELGATHHLKDAEIELIGQQYEVSFAQLSNAVQMARLVAPDGAPSRGPLEGVLSASERLVLGKSPPHRSLFDPSRFRLEAVNCVGDVSALVEAAVRWSPERGVPLTMCFFGPPGTGKTELGQYLAWRMKRRCLVKRVSDILSMWVGASEQNIAAAFREAQEDGAVLVFDEVDSLLRDRRGAQHSWEATQVNEFLQQLEAYRGAIVCTTNLFQALDAAALRRFAFKLEFRYLRPEQCVPVFRAHFEELLPGAWDQERLARLEVQLGRVRTLAPGDFASVSRRLRMLGRPVTDAAVIEALRAESSARGASAALGFNAA